MDDNGAGTTLREAIVQANSTSNFLPIVNFNLSGDGSGTTWTISLDNALGPLPDLTVPMVLDATTQPGWNMDGDRLVVIDGANMTTNNISGITTAAECEIYGFKITGFQCTNCDGIVTATGSNDARIGGPGRGNVINNNDDKGVDVLLE